MTFYFHHPLSQDALLLTTSHLHVLPKSLLQNVISILTSTSMVARYFESSWYIEDVLVYSVCFLEI